MGSKRMRGLAKVQFQLFGTFKREGSWVVAHCPPLDITTQGRTISEAKKNLVEASELFIISCLERGTLDLALRELGFVGPLKGKQESLPANAFSFPVPIPLHFQKKPVAECHA
jgi:predicted RNase H-like HicB family nuclease